MNCGLMMKNDNLRQEALPLHRAQAEGQGKLNLERGDHRIHSSGDRDVHCIWKDDGCKSGKI